MTRRTLPLLLVLVLALSCVGVWAAPSLLHPTVPVITSHNATAAVAMNENATNVASLTYTPLDAVLSVSGADSVLFSADPVLDGGRLSFLAAPDYETPGDVGTNNVYNVTVTATYAGRTDATDFTVTVADVDEGTPGGDVTAPTVSTKTIDAAGTTLTVVFSENVTGSGGLSLSPSGGPASLVYASGSGTSTYTYTISREILLGETVTLSASSSNIVDGAANTLANFTGSSITNNSTQTAGVGDSLRPTVFPSVPSEPGTAGFTQNDLSTSVRTDVSKTSRAATVEIAAGTYTEPYTASTANRTIKLMGNITYDGAGIIINAANITVDLNGYTLTYMNTDMEDQQTGTVSSASGGDGVTRPSMVVTGVTNSGVVVEFLTGDEAGNWYEVYSGAGTSNLTLENHTYSTDTGSVIQSWVNGGPTAGDTFRICDPRKTFGVGTLRGVYNKSGVEIVNGSIVQGSASGRGWNIDYNTGCAPIYTGQGQTSWTIGGVAASWSSGNTRGFDLNNTSGTIKYCELNDLGSFLSNRQRGVAVIRGYATAQYNRIINHRHIGIDLSSGVTAEYNEVYGDSRVTNAYGIGGYAVIGCTVRYNNIYKTGEHPICLAIHNNSGSNEYHDNWCEAKVTRSSSEYPWNYSSALSIRFGTRATSNHIHDNALITYSEDGVGANTESRGRTVFLGALTGSAGELIEDNFIGAYNTDDETPCHAIGLSLHNNTLVVRDNTIVASHNHYWVGEDYGNGESGGRFISNTLTKVGSDPNFDTFKTNGYYTGNADFISNTYGTGTGNAASDIGSDEKVTESGFATPDSGNIFRFGYNLTVTVTNGGSPVSGATVTVKDASNNTLRSGYTTNGSGVVVVDVPTFYRQGAAFGSTSLNALTVSAVSGAASGSNTISPTSDDSITVTISP